MRRQAGGMPPPVRVTRRQDGTFALEFDQMRESDQALIDTSGAASSIISRDLAAQLDGAILHFRSMGDDQYGDPGVAVLRSRSGTPRAEWTQAVPPSKT